MANVVSTTSGSSGTEKAIRVQPGTGALYMQGDQTATTSSNMATNRIIASGDTTTTSVIAFKDLAGIPGYTGNAGKVLTVNQGESGVIWKKPFLDFSYTFPLYFTTLGSDNPSAIQAELPNGWRIDVTGTTVIVYHTVGRMPTFMTFMGRQNDGSWAFRLPTTFNNLVIPNGMSATAFQFVASPVICGTGDPETQVRVTVYF